MPTTKLIVLLCAAVSLLAPPALASDPAEQHARVLEIVTPGGPLPVVCELQRVRSTDGADAWSAHLKNGADANVFGDIRVEVERPGPWTVRRVRVELLGEHSVLEWTEIDRGWDEPARGSGVWTKRRHDEVFEFPVIVRGIDDIAWSPPEGAAPATPGRFTPIESDRAPDPGAFTGTWRVEFEGMDDPAVATFEVDDRGMAVGTFNTTVSDFRFLSGRVDGDLLRLSTFDGRDSYLFHARLGADGSLRGDFWSGSWWHDTWTATRDEGATLNDGFARTRWVGGATFDQLVFRTLDGRRRSVGDVLDEFEADGGRATLLLVFGTWCPNCADAIDYLAELAGEHGGEGLRVLGLAFEYTGDIETDARQVRLHRERHGGDWPVLVAGLSDKKAASEALPVLDRLRAYPTVVFINADREPVAVYSGFAGPAAGEAHHRLRERWSRLVEGMLGVGP